MFSRALTHSFIHTHTLFHAHTLLFCSWVWIGTNDIIRDECRLEQVAAGIVTIVQELRQQRPDAWIVVQSLLPSEHAAPNVVDAINAAIQCLANSTPQTFFYNSSHVFGMPKTAAATTTTTTIPWVNASRLANDGIHPNGEGSRAWAQSMMDYLRRLYQEQYYH